MLSELSGGFWYCCVLSFDRSFDMAFGIATDRFGIQG